MENGKKLPTKLIILLQLLVLSVAASPDFSGKPMLSDNGSLVTIRFSLNTYSDVTVWIEDDAGTKIRHIASGVLGSNPPRPFTANSLSQQVDWDKKDDLGKPYTGSYKVKIGLGLKAGFDRFYGFNPANEVSSGLGTVTGLGVDTAGNLIIRTDSWRGNPGLYVFKRTGEYLKTLEPLPGDLPVADAKKYGAMDLGGGKWAPKVYNSHHGTTIPEMHGSDQHNITVTSKGWVLIPNSRGKFYGWSAKWRRMLIINMDGTVPRDSLFGPVLVKEAHAGRIITAVSADERWLYATGIRRGAYGSGSSASPLRHIVFKSEVGSGDTMAIFAGVKDSAGTGDRYFNNPTSVAVDGFGRVYVADKGNNRIMIFDSNGTLLSKKACISPSNVMVDKTTGNVYADIRPSSGQFRIVKYGPYPALDSLIGHVIVSTSDPVMVLDKTGNNPVIWYINQNTVEGLVDEGSNFSALPVKIGKPTPDAMQALEPTGGLESPGYIAVDPMERVLFAGNNKWSRINLSDGRVVNTNVRGVEVAFDKEGTLYSWCPGNNTTDSVMAKYDYLGNPVNFAGKTSNKLSIGKTYIYGPYVGTRGFFINDSGDFYLPLVSGFGDYSKEVNLHVFNKEGVLKRSGVIRFIDSLKGAAGGFTIDHKNNVYMCAGLWTKGETFPSWYSGHNLPLGKTWSYAQTHAYSIHLGSLFKFPPEGGTIRNLKSFSPSLVPASTWTGDTVPYLQVSGYGNKVYRVEGPTWQYFGVSPVPTWDDAGDPGCQCFTPRLSVDRFERVFVPDALQFTIQVLDANRNVITKIGSYGNSDQTGPNSLRVSPEIPLAYPMYVQKINERLYISDVGAHRIVRANLGYSALFNGDTILYNTANERSGVINDETALNIAPNPFNPVTRISVNLDLPKKINLEIFSSDGKLVKTLTDRQYGRGAYHFEWNANGFSSGVYFAKLTADSKVIVKRLMLCR